LITGSISSAEKGPVNGRVLDTDIVRDRPLHRPNDWLVWQLIDSAFPTGGFAHSSGLEAAWQQGEVHGRDELVMFLEANLGHCGHATLPFVGAAYDSPDELADFDSLCDVFMTNHVANRASRAQGRAFLNAAKRLFPTEMGNQKAEPAFAHIATVFGACMCRLGVCRETTTRMFFFNHLRAILAAAVRLNIMGPMEAQLVQNVTSAKAEKILKKCESLSLDDIAQTAPLLEIWQGAQDRLYSRLFQS
jgi:urease accessory protein